MGHPVPMIEIWRGDLVESLHLGHAVVCDHTGDIVEAWGQADKIIFPRSSCKMLQALPLIESGAADAYGLGPEHLALACASHQGAVIHTERVSAWLKDLQMRDEDFRCGSEFPRDKPAANDLVRGAHSVCQMHNNCSGKHSGFLTLGKHIGAGPEYVEVDHPTQIMVREAFEDMTQMTSPGYGIDGCSAPNFATSLHGLARAVAAMAKPDLSTLRGRAAARLVDAMRAHPELVAGEGRACTELMRACGGKAAVKTGAEAVFIAILPEMGLGIAVKIADGGTRAAEAAIAGLLVRHGALEADHPTAKKWMHGPITNRRDLVTGQMKFASGFL